MAHNFADGRWELVDNYEGDPSPIAVVWRLKVQGGWLVAVVTVTGEVSTAFAPDIDQ